MPQNKSLRPFFSGFFTCKPADSQNVARAGERARKHGSSWYCDEIEWILSVHEIELGLIALKKVGKKDNIPLPSVIIVIKPIFS